MRTRIDTFTIQRWPETAAPSDMRHLVELEQEVELFAEQRIIVAQMVAKQRIGFGERTPANHQFRSAFRNEIECRELLKHPHRVGSADDRHRACQPDSLRTRRRSRENNGRPIPKTSRPTWSASSTSASKLSMRSEADCKWPVLGLIASIAKLSIPISTLHSFRDALLRTCAICKLDNAVLICKGIQECLFQSDCGFSRGSGERWPDCRDAAMRLSR